MKSKAAKAAEVRNFISAQAFEALPAHLKPSREQAIGMRWLLTWKVQEDGSVKPKARAILLGYQDPSYEHRSTTASFRAGPILMSYSVFLVMRSSKLCSSLQVP